MRAQHVHGGVVELVARHAGRELELADVVHHHRADDAGGRPCGQQPAMDRADELRPEHVGEIGRHRGEAAAIHRQDDAEGQHEHRLRSDRGEQRRQGVERDAEDEERVVGVLASDVVRQRRPAEPAGDVEQREQAGEARRDCGDLHALLAASSALNLTPDWPIRSPAKISCSIGEAMPITPMPAETFSVSTHQISQNCGVLCASFRWTWCCVIIDLVSLGGVQPSGRQPAGGMR